MAVAKESEQLVVLQSFVGRVDGVDRPFRRGDLIAANNPAAKKWPHLFGPARSMHDPVIEQATAAPGEKRDK